MGGRRRVAGHVTGQSNATLSARGPYRESGLPFAVISGGPERAARCGCTSRGFPGAGRGAQLAGTSNSTLGAYEPKAKPGGGRQRRQPNVVGSPTRHGAARCPRVSSPQTEMSRCCSSTRPTRRRLRVVVRPSDFYFFADAVTEPRCQSKLPGRLRGTRSRHLSDGRVLLEKQDCPREKSRFR